MDDVTFLQASLTSTDNKIQAQVCYFLLADITLKVNIIGNMQPPGGTVPNTNKKTPASHKMTASYLLIMSYYFNPLYPPYPRACQCPHKYNFFNSHGTKEVTYSNTCNGVFFFFYALILHLTKEKYQSAEGGVYNGENGGGDREGRRECCKVIQKES